MEGSGSGIIPRLIGRSEIQIPFEVVTLMRLGLVARQRDLRHVAVRHLVLCADRRASSLVVQNT